MVRQVQEVSFQVTIPQLRTVLDLMKVVLGLSKGPLELISTKMVG
jgi:hypothetical protein